MFQNILCIDAFDSLANPKFDYSSHQTSKCTSSMARLITSIPISEQLRVTEMSAIY